MLCEQTVPKTDRQADMMKQIVTFCDFMHVPKNIPMLASLQLMTCMPFLVPQRHTSHSIAPTICLCQHLHSSTHALG